MWLKGPSPRLPPVSWLLTASWLARLRLPHLPKSVFCELGYLARKPSEHYMRHGDVIIASLDAVLRS